jgi:hypothetical protein
LGQLFGIVMVAGLPEQEPVNVAAVFAESVLSEFAEL